MALITKNGLAKGVRKHGGFDKGGHRKVARELAVMLEEGEFAPEDFSIRDLAEGLVPNGTEYVNRLRPGAKSGFDFMEAAAPIDTSAFSNITGQIIYNRLIEAFADEEFVVSRLIDTIDTPFDGEKIAGISKIGDEAEVVAESQPYPEAGVSEDYIETPSTEKRGFIVPVTREAIFFDRTGLMLARASEVGKYLGLNKEKRCIDVVIGATNNHKWKGTTYNTYQTSSPWINTKSSNDLVDWTDIDAAEQLFNDLLDPNVGEPIIATPNTILCTPARRQAAARVIGAEQIRVTGSGAITETIARNPYAGTYGLATSRLLLRRILNLQADTAKANAWWFLGDFKAAFAYMQNWAIEVVTAANNSEAEFTRDVVVRYKASERGVAAVKQPRAVVWNYDAA